MVFLLPKLSTVLVHKMLSSTSSRTNVPSPGIASPSHGEGGCPRAEHEWSSEGRVSPRARSPQARWKEFSRGEVTLQQLLGTDMASGDRKR